MHMLFNTLRRVVTYFVGVCVQGTSQNRSVGCRGGRSALFRMYKLLKITVKSVIKILFALEHTNLLDK
jgi:hypothetical protein